MRSTLVLSLSLLVLPGLAAAQHSGERCDTAYMMSPEGEYQCLPAVDEDGYPEYQATLPALINAERGDILMTAGCGGTVSTLLRSVGQSYSHSGMLLGPHNVRHSTGSEDWLMKFPDFGLLDGFQGPALRFLWPGVIDQGVRDAMYGGFVFDDVTQDDYLIHAFDAKVQRCAPDEPKFPPILVKALLAGQGPQGPEWDDEAVRSQRHAAADAMEQLSGHYRFGAYTNAATLSPAPQDLAWLPGSAATVCSQAVWLANRSAGVQLEGPLEESDCAGVDDACVPGASQPALHEGLYDYSEASRQEGASVLHSLFQELVQDKLSEEDFAEELQWLEDPMNQVPNQIVNCFAFDWCDTDHGPTDLDGTSVVCGDDDPRDSTCWTNPGPGRAVSPDDILRWDGPDKHPDSIHGHQEDARPVLGEWERVHRWERVDGLGDIQGRLLYDGAPVNLAEVRMGPYSSGTTSQGTYEFQGLPPDLYEMQACKELDSGTFLVADEMIPVLPNTELQLGDLDMQPAFDCPFPLLENPQLYRRVTLAGTLKVRDDEWWPEDDVVESFDLQDVMLPSETSLELLLCEGSPLECPPEQTVSFQACVGGEVRAEVSVTARLVDGVRVSVTAAVRLYEGATGNCLTTLDLDGEKSVTSAQEAPEDPIGLHVFVKNGDWEEDDEVVLDLGVTNEPWGDLSDL
jgi:hypothetical protein